MNYELARPSTAAEWAAYHDIRRVAIFERYLPGQTYDPEDADEFKELNFPHLLRHDEDAIGTLRIDVLGDARAAFRLIAIRPDLLVRGTEPPCCGSRKSVPPPSAAAKSC